MRRLAFKTVWSHASVERISIDQGSTCAIIADEAAARQKLFLVISGCVTLRVTYHGVTSVDVARSGDFFDYQLFKSRRHDMLC